MSTKPRTSAGLVVAGAACLLALVAAACSGSDKSTSKSTGPTAATTADGGTVPHATLADGSPAPRPTLADGSPAPTLANGSPAPTLVGGAPAPTLANGSPAPTLAGGAPDPSVLTIDNETYSSVTGVHGQAIRIFNNDSKDHTVTDSNGAFDVSIAAGGTASVTVTAAGTYQIHCKIHSSMQGTIVVT